MRILVFMLVLTTAAQGQEVTTASSMLVSDPLRAVRIGPTKNYFDQLVLPEIERERPPRPAAELADAAAQTAPGPDVGLSVTLNVPGIQTPATPPDPTGAVGMNQYVQAVNSRGLAVFDKANGKMVFGPTAISNLWQGTKDLCGSYDHGDPIVVYDKIAHRWVISQFLVRRSKKIFSECVAVSTSEDATGTYNLYRFDYRAMPDYPKLAVWPDAYYASYKMFRGESGSRACAFERERMLVGAPANQARQVCFHVKEAGITGLMPSDFDGGLLPSPGAPNVFARRELAKQQLSFRRFHVDWMNPDRSTFGQGDDHDPDAVLDVAAFSDACPTTRLCVSQRGTPQKLDDLGNRLMFRNAYRRFQNHEAMVLNHSIKGSPVAIRWYEIRDPIGTPTLYQQGTFRPDQSARWMGSIATDRVGNIALGYSIGGSARRPGINVTARTPDMALGVLGHETAVTAGVASQTHSARWGDYSHLTVDPVDECTFWFTAEYIGGTAPRRRTRIAAFRVSNCTNDTASQALKGIELE